MIGVVDILTNDPTVSALTGGQIYYNIEPPGKKVPYVLVSTESVFPNPGKNCVSTIDYMEVEVFSIGSKMVTTGANVGAYSLSEACRAALDQASGVYGGQDIGRIDFEDYREYHDIEANHVKHTVSQQYRVILKR